MKRLLFAACVLFPAMAWADTSGIPENCNSPEITSVAASSIPGLLGVSAPDAATIVQVTPWSQGGVGQRQNQGPYGNGYALQCMIVVSWSNGLKQLGTLHLFDDQYGQAMVSFAVSIEYQHGVPVWSAANN